MSPRSKPSWPWPEPRRPLTRAELADHQRALDELKTDLVEAFGEGVLR